MRDSSDIELIAKMIDQRQEKTVIVVSALWGVTDRLLRAANEPRYATRLVSDLRKQHLRFSPGLDDSIFAEKFDKVLFGIDKSLFNLSKSPESYVDVNTLLAAGERLSALVVAHELRKRNMDAHPVGSEDVGICLDGSDTASSVDIQTSIKKLDHAAFFGIPVITGWFGEGHDGNLALLSRGGSDHSAAAIARILDAQKLVLWKDVDGVLSINPRWGVKAEPIPYLGYDEARELSRMDAPVIHHTTVLPIRDHGIPIEVRNLHSKLDSYAPTIIGPGIIDSNQLKAIGCMRSIAKITAEVADVEKQSKVLGQMLLSLDKENITCWSVESSQTTIEIVVSQQQLTIAEGIVGNLSEISNVDYYSCLISFIGTNDLDVVYERLKKTNVEYSDLEYLNSTKLSVQFVANTEDIKLLMKQLSMIIVETSSA